MIHVLQPQLLNLFKKVLGKFIKPSILSVHFKSGTLSSLDYSTTNQVDNKDLCIGFLTKPTVTRLHEEGDISDTQFRNFFEAVRKSLVGAADYLLRWCPFEDDLLVHATWLDFEQRLQKNFVHRFPNALDNIDMDRLNEEYINYQLLSAEDMSPALKCEENLRVDYLWGYLKGIKEPGTNVFAFGQLFRVAEVVMNIPHSNANEERIFSLINKNKTPSRSSLQLNGTLSSLIVIKTHIIDNPLKWKPSNAVIEKAKHATRTYNDQHKS